MLPTRRQLSASHARLLVGVESLSGLAMVDDARPIGERP